MKSKIEIKCIGLNDKLPKGWNYLSSWDCERLLHDSPKVFSHLENSTDVGHYQLRNKRYNKYLWLRWLDVNSFILNDNGSLFISNWVRGVLIWKS